MMLDELRMRLQELGANRIPHSRRSLFDHLVGTGEILRAWDCDVDVCAAGMFHSIYGTNAFALSCLDRRDRDRLRDLIGERAEELAYLFCVSNRPYGILQAAKNAQLVNRFTGEIIVVSPADIRELLEIECANLIEQRAGHRFLVELVGLSGAAGASLLKPRIAVDVHEFLGHLTKFAISSDLTNGASMEVNTVPSLIGADAAQFDERGYVVLRNLLSRRFLDVSLRYYLSYLKVPDYYSVSESTRALNRYADALGEAFIPEIQPVIERHIGRKLIPTYSFARIYTTESRLSKHVDRGACEISATMTVGYKNANGLWPIFLEYAGEDIPVELDVGDALIYRGMDLPHSRKPLESGFWCQLFFHFVETDGALTEHRFDGRDRLGPFMPTVA